MKKHDARIGMGYDFKAGGIFKDMTFEKERTLLQVQFIKALISEGQGNSCLLQFIIHLTTNFCLLVNPVSVKLLNCY